MDEAVLVRWWDSVRHFRRDDRVASLPGSRTVLSGKREGGCVIRNELFFFRWLLW